MRLALALSSFALIAAPAAAQVGPALDPGAMVGWAGGEAVRYSLKHPRGSKAKPMSASEAKARATCARRYTYSSRLGIDHPTTRRLFALCKRAGYY
jgi:hypothetical protein